MKKQVELAYMSTKSLELTKKYLELSEKHDEPLTCSTVIDDKPAQESEITVRLAEESETTVRPAEESEMKEKLVGKLEKYRKKYENERKLREI